MKSLNKSSLSKRKKRKLLIFSSGLFSMFAIAMGWSLTIVLPNVNNKITSLNSNLHGLNNSTSTTQNVATFTVNSKQSALNKTASQVTSEDIQSVLSASSSISSFSVVILPLTETNINKGYVNFLIYQTYNDGSTVKTVFADASQSKNSSSSSSYQTNDTIDENTLNKYGITSGSTTTNPTSTNVFSTAQIDNLSGWITAEKYNLEWKTDAELKSYITSTNATTLTNDMFVNNFFSNTTNLPEITNTTPSNNQPYTKITIQSVDKNGTEDTNNKLGLFKVTIVIYNTSKSNWNDDNFPAEATGGGSINDTSSTATLTITKYFGGFNTSTGERFTVDIDSELQTIRNWTISDISLFNGASNDKNKVSDLTPSQFESPLGGKTKLISLFSTGTGLSNSGTTSPIVQYSFNDDKFKFYDSSVTDNNSSSTSNGLIGEINKQKNNIKITNISTVANDVDGSLKVVITYDCYSIYSGTVVSQMKTYEYPAGTFATSIQPENLLFTWKDVNSLSSYGLNTTYDIVNEFMKNKDNTTFVRLFTNQFINASSEVKEKDRTATIVYGSVSGQTELPESNNTFNDATGAYTPGNSANGKAITIRLTFNNWNGTTESKIFQQSFTFTNIGDDGKYTYSQSSSITGYDDSLTLTWKTNSDVLKANSSYASSTPSTIIYNLMKNASQTTLGSISQDAYSNFVVVTGTNASEINVSFQANDSDGSILMFVSKTSSSTDSSIKPQNAHIYSQLFTGFKKTSDTSGVVSFSWTPNEQVSGELQSMSVNSVTKEDIIKYYLNSSSLFQNGDLDAADITLTPNISDNSLIVSVTMPFFNQDSITTTTRTFFTKLTGFASYNYKNSSSFAPPKNMTAVFSISAATVISLTLGIILLALLLKRSRIRNLKSYHDGILNKKKTNKKIRK